MRPGDDETRDMLVLTQGSHVNQYRIIERISSGGMGEVFLAEDTRLKRKVAIKFPFSGHDPDVNLRFLREAEATARLNHPNVVTIHEIGECRDRSFIVMEHIEGESLKSFCQRQTLGLDRIIELICGICDGLAFAHDKEVIHRDIKPANIVIDARGCPKILDFGLAKLKDTEQQSKLGSVVGTIGYMSPEQIRGETLDHRTDLFSLGVMFYELLTGNSPFDVSSEAAILHSILHDDVKPITQYRADVPVSLEQIVYRLLERDRTRRSASASEVSSDLRSSGAQYRQHQPVSRTSKKSILVLPFENSGADQEDVYFSNGLTEEIITDLGKIEDIMVISRKSSMQLAGTNKDLRTLGREYVVQYVLTGSVRRAVQNIRVHVELVEPSSDRQLWSERYSGVLDDVFDIQEKIARAIAHALKLRLSESEKIALARRGIRTVKAHDLYLRARQETTRWSREGLDQAHRFLEEALRQEPESAVLHAALGYNYYNYVNLGFHQDDSIAKALECVRKARELEPDSIDARRLLGIIQVSLTGEGREGLRNLQKVLECSPQDTEAMLWMALGAGFRGKTELGIQWADRLVRVEPFVVLNEVFQATAYFLNGNFAQAYEIASSAYSRDPGNTLVMFVLALVLLYQGRSAKAIACVMPMESRPALGVFDRLILALTYAVQGQREKMETVLNEDCRTSARRDLQYPWHIGVAYAMLGDYDEALTWIRLAVDNGFANYRFLEELDPFLAPLRNKPEYIEIVKHARHEAHSA